LLDSICSATLKFAKTVGGLLLFVRGNTVHTARHVAVKVTFSPLNHIYDGWMLLMHFNVSDCSATSGQPVGFDGWVMLLLLPASPRSCGAVALAPVSVPQAMTQRRAFISI